MQGSARRTVLVAAALVAGAALAAFGSTPGNVVGANEVTPFNLLSSAFAKVTEAHDTAQGAEIRKPLPAAFSDEIKPELQSALDLLEGAKAAIGPAGDYQDSTRADLALKTIEDAEAEIHAGATTSPTDTAIFDIRSAMYAFMGTPLTKKDKAAVAANGTPPETDVHDGEIHSTKTTMKLTADDIEAGRGDAQNGKTTLKKERFPKIHTESTTLGLTVAATGRKPNFYYAFEGTSADAGYIFKTLGRDLFGPFETRFQVGSFDFYNTDDTGSACVEFDVKGSSPLQFYAVCGRRINGGVQVFAQSNTGAQGNLFLAGSNVAQVIVTYSGTAFSVKAGPRDVPEIFFGSLPGYSLTQGATPLVAGIGGSGLTKGVVIGLDEIYFTAK